MIVPDLVYDVGMHVGNDTANYLRDGYRVIGIEANPILVDYCRQRFAREISAGMLRILPVGVTDKNSVMPFFVNPRNTEWSSFLKEVGWRDGEGEVIEVPTVRFDEVLAHYGSPYYLKCDIETSDLLVMQSLRSLDKENLPQYVSVESHSLEYLVILRTLGYEKYKVVDQRAHGLLACSGPFGEKAPGQWMSLEEAAYEWMHFNSKHLERLTWLPKDHATWHDFHAKRTW